MNTQPVADTSRLLEHLLADYQWLEDILQLVYSASEMDDEPRVKKLWSEFEWDLSAHLRAEEALLLPALRRSDEHGAQLLGEGHTNLRARLDELGVRVKFGFVPLHLVCRFIDDLRDHARLGDSLWDQLSDDGEGADRSSFVTAIVDVVLRANPAAA